MEKATVSLTRLPRKLGTREQYLGHLEWRNDPSADLVKYFIRNGISVMPFFRKTENSDTELDAPARYLQKQEAPKVSLTSR
jgi:hypothetical protein